MQVLEQTSKHILPAFKSGDGARVTWLKYNTSAQGFWTAGSLPLPKRKVLHQSLFQNEVDTLILPRLQLCSHP